MKFRENYCKRENALPQGSGKSVVKQKGEANLTDINSQIGPANPSLMLWAVLGLSAEHSYLFLPLS